MIYCFCRDRVPRLFFLFLFFSLFVLSVYEGCHVAMHEMQGSDSRQPACWHKVRRVGMAPVGNGDILQEIHGDLHWGFQYLASKTLHSQSGCYLSDPKSSVLHIDSRPNENCVVLPCLGTLDPASEPKPGILLVVEDLFVIMWQSERALLREAAPLRSPACGLAASRWSYTV